MSEREKVEIKTLHNDFVQRNHDRTFLDSPSFYNNYSLKNIASAVVTINCHYPRSTEEAEDLAKLQKDDEVSVMVAPILVWAAGVLAAAGLSWLAEKLLDYGAKKFCDTYGNYNSVTKTVCNVIAP